MSYERSYAFKATWEHCLGAPAIVTLILVFIGCPTVGAAPTLSAASALLIVYFLVIQGREINRLAALRIQEKQRELDSEQQRVQSEAEYLTRTLATIHDSAPNHVQSLGRYIQLAETDLDTAEHDFRDSAFAPFWDSIERAVNNLSSLDQTTRQLTGHAQQYYTLLRDRDHTFPQFPVVLTALPDPTHTTIRMQAIVRKAQCNFQFATIYEQRKTNNILKHGFMSLSSAISDLGSTICGSIDDLRDSMSSGLATLSEQQIATRESIESAAALSRAASEEMLAEARSGNKAAATGAKEQAERDRAAAKIFDNLQRRRKPVPPQPGDGDY